MIEFEFIIIFGFDWVVGKGLVDWFFYVLGKIFLEYGF